MVNRMSCNSTNPPLPKKSTFYFIKVFISQDGKVEFIKSLMLSWVKKRSCLELSVCWAPVPNIDSSVDVNPTLTARHPVPSTPTLNNRMYFCYISKNWRIIYDA